MPQYVQFILEMETKIFAKAISPEIIQKVKELYNLEVNPEIVKKCIQLLITNHDLWYDDVVELLNESNQKMTGSFFALKLAFQAEGLEVLNYRINEPNNEYHAEHIINRLKKRGYSPWA